MIEVKPAFSYPRCIHLRNAEVELIITTDVGPRILSYRRLAGGENLFKIFEEQLGGEGEFGWQARGGHRSWVAPEDNSLTYAADNVPIPWEQEGEYQVVLLNPPMVPWQIQKELTVRLVEEGARVELIHRIRNRGTLPIAVASWGLTVMRPGGFLLLPQPVLGEHPRDLLPNRRWVLWPYTDPGDARWEFGADFLTLQQREGAEVLPTKMGVGTEEGLAYYVHGKTVFAKRFEWKADAIYPDMGCNFETFTNREMLEVESLGPLVNLEPGEATEHLEEWDLFEVDTAPPRSAQAEWKAVLARHAFD